MIRTGRYCEAISIFEESAQFLDRSLSFESSNSVPVSLGDSLINNNNRQYPTQILNVPYNSCDDFYIFLNPMDIPKDSICDDHNLFIKFASLASLYNLGLSYHLSAHNIDKYDRRKLLEKALSCYEIVYNTLTHEDVIVLTEVMILLNNVAHVHLLLQNDAGAKVCFRHLLNTMVFVLESGNSSRVNGWENFLSNFMGLLTVQEQSVAPAA